MPPPCGATHRSQQGWVECVAHHNQFQLPYISGAESAHTQTRRTHNAKRTVSRNPQIPPACHTPVHTALQGTRHGTHGKTLTLSESGHTTQSPRVCRPQTHAHTHAQQEARQAEWVHCIATRQSCCLSSSTTRPQNNVDRHTPRVARSSLPHKTGRSTYCMRIFRRVEVGLQGLLQNPSLVQGGVCSHAQPKAGRPWKDGAVKDAA